MLSAIRLTALLVIASAIAGSAYGQRHQTTSQVPRYVPQSPTVSPYINLVNGRNGVATNYYGLVRPLERQQRINESQSLQTSNQEQQINQLSDKQNAKQEAVQIQQPKVKPTGTAGWYQTLGSKPPYGVADHYYGQWPDKGKTMKRNGARH